MTDNQPFALPHLSAEQLIKSNPRYMSAYLIALEGWRRGLKLKYYARSTTYKMGKKRYAGRLFTLSSKDRHHFFIGAMGDKNTWESVYNVSSKDRTKKLFASSGIPVPKGKLFDRNASNDDIVNYAVSLGRPIVLKPDNGTRGDGVFAGVQGEVYFKKIVSHLREDLNYNRVIVEEFFSGNDHRIYVIGDRVVAAGRREPANVLGDGIQSVKELIAEKNGIRRKNPIFAKRLIDPDMEVAKKIHEAGYTLDSIPQKGELLYLRSKSNASTGGDMVDVTDNLPPYVGNMAVRALHATGLKHGGVDILVDEKEPKNCVVLEVNAFATFGQMFPTKGQPRDIVSALIDCYFPETKGLSGKSVYYLNLESTLAPLRNNTALAIEVPPALLGEVVTKKYILRGGVKGVGLRQWIQKMAHELSINGYCRYLKNGSIEVVASGKQDKIEEFKQACKLGSSRAKVEKLIEKQIDQPIETGFVIKEKKISKTYYDNKLVIKKAELETLRQINIKYESKIKTKEAELETLRKRLDKVKQSRSWRLTASLRSIKNKIIKCTSNK